KTVTHQKVGRRSWGHRGVTPAEVRDSRVADTYAPVPWPLWRSAPASSQATRQAGGSTGMSQLGVLRADASTAAAIITHATGRPVHQVPKLHPRRSTDLD